MKQLLTFTLSSLALIAMAAEPQLSNGSFEQGTGGYWIGQPSMVRVDATDSTDGKQCLSITPTDGKRVDIVQGVALKPDAIYVISFDARCESAGQVPDLTLHFMLQGNKPLAFFEPKGTQKKEFATPAALTGKWRKLTYEVGPFPEKSGNSDVKKIMLYLRIKGEGRIYLDNLNITTKEAPPAPKAEAALLQNGSFEQGTAHYWINSPASVKSDSSDASAGDRCLTVSPADGKTVNIVQGFDFKPDKTYRISFDARCESETDVPQIKLTFMLQGNKPLAFFAPKGEQKTKLASAPALTAKWQSFEYEVGPFPAKYGASDVKKVMLYFNIKGPGKLYLDNVKVSEAELPQPDITFNLPAPVQIYENPPTPKILGRVGTSDVLRATATDAFGNQVVLREGRPGEQQLDLPLPGPDYYLIRAEIIRDGKVTANRETSLLLTTPLPKDYYDTPHPAFGVWGGLNREMRALAGAKWDRQLFFTAFQKDDFQPSPPTPEQIAAREPIKIIRCMNIMNPFKKMVPYTHEELQEQREKLTKEVISRRGLVDIWETQNEPMVGENFHGTMNDVMDIIRLESEVVRKNDPGAKIAGICINPMNANQYNQYIGYFRNHNIADYIDSIMLHPYIPGAQSPDASGYVDILNRLGREVSTLAGRNIPMYISEIGYSTRPGGEVSELQQAAYLARVVLLNRLIPDLKACVWHIGLWNDATSQRELDFGLLRKHAKGSPRREPKPAFAAWATVSRQTYNAEFLRELNISRRVRVLLFEREGKPLLVAYALTPDPVKFQLPINAPEVTITEVCGKTYTKKLPDGILSLELTEAPVYISGGKLADFDSGKFAAVFKPEQLQTTAGVPLTIDVTLPEGLTGTIRVQDMTFASASVKGGGRQWQITVTPGRETAPGNYDLFIRLDDDGSSRYIWQKNLQVLPPLTLKNITVTHDGKYPELNFDVASNAPNTPKTELRILAAADKVLASTTVEAGKSGKMPLKNAAYGRPVHYRAAFKTPGGNTWTQILPDSILPVTIPFCDNALNTPADQWPARGLYCLNGGQPSRHAVRGEFDRPEGTLRLAYDANNLYFAVNVKDRTVQTRDGASLWDGDSLQIAVSVPQKFMIRPNNDGIQETAYAEFGLKADGKTPDSWVWASMNLNEMPLNQPIPNLISRHSRAGDETRYLFAIPWRVLNIKPAADMPMGISLLVNDRDAGKDRHWLEWYGGIADGKDPSRYGSAVLLPR